MIGEATVKIVMEIYIKDLLFVSNHVGPFQHAPVLLTNHYFCFLMELHLNGAPHLSRITKQIHDSYRN